MVRFKVQQGEEKSQALTQRDERQPRWSPTVRGLCRGNDAFSTETGTL